MNILKHAEKRTYGAIVIGSGVAGGWAAKEFCDKGIKTLVLERGRKVTHNEDYPTTLMSPWEFPHRGRLTNEEIAENPVVSKCYAFREDAKQFFVKDKEHPYIQDKPFDWIRGYQVGGKSLLWARQTQRWSKYDFEGPARDGFAVPWPISYDDLAPWYSHVEYFAGISGNKDGLDSLPDGDFLPAFELNCVEKHFQKELKRMYQDRHVIVARCAHLSEPREIHLQQGRGRCLSRNLCQRGCPYGGYFSSNSSTLPWAAKTGNLTLRPDSVVESIIYDEKKQKAVGVRVVDANTKEMIEYYAKVVFVTAAAINTNLLLLNSTSHRFPNGLGNDSGVLGKYVAFHNYRASISAEYDGYLDTKTEGSRPTSGYIPRFRNVYKQETDFLRGYAAGMSAGRGNSSDRSGVGESLKNSLLNPKLNQNWYAGSHMMGETIPKESNKVWLDDKQKDAWGMPLLHMSVGYDANDDKMVKDFIEQFTEMYSKAGFTNIRSRDTKQPAGLDIHEMGGCRMGSDPKNSMLNKWNQMHAVKNVFVTDGASMTSTSTQNPSLTYMALTARAVDYAVKEMKKGNL
jgi:choline dehydrogenase-like flavoprotein